MSSDVALAPVDHKEKALDHKKFGLEDRAQFMRRHIGELDVTKNKATLKAAIKRLARYPEGHEKAGQKLPIKEFEARIFDLFSVVFTGHPVWNMTEQEFQAFVTRIIHNGDDKNGLAAKEALEKAAEAGNFTHPDLDRENEDTFRAIRHANNALRWAEEIAMEVGQEEYPDEWTTINYTVGLIYKWTIHDWDGRKDIEWNQPFADKMRLQFEKFRSETIPDFEALKKHIKNEDDLSAIDQILTKLDYSASTMEEMFPFFKNYDPDKDVGQKDLQAAELKLLETKKDRITHPRELTEALDKMLANVDSDDIEAQHAIVALRSALNGRGISLSRTHSRINSSQIEAAHTKGLPDTEAKKSPIDQGIIPNGTETPKVDKPSLGGQYSEKLDDHIDLIKATEKEEPSLVDLVVAEHSVAKQILVSKMTGELINEHEQIVHLIADHISEVHTMGLLSFIYRYQAEKYAFPVGLAEERIGLENFANATKEVMKNRHYQAFIKETFGNNTFPYNRIMQQGGFSDLMRQDGLTATSWQNRVGEQFVNAASKYLDDLIGIIYFATGGSHVFRGYHWGSFQRYLERAITPHSLANAQRKDRLWNYTPQISFQGQDAFLMFGSNEIGFSTIAQMIDHVTKDHSPSLKDIWNAKYKQTKVIATGIRNETTKINSNPDFVDMIWQWQNLIPRAGSRALGRGGNKRVRAILQSNTLGGMLEFPAHAVIGFNKAAHDNPNIFRERFHHSDHFRTSDIEVLDIIMDLFDPRVGLEKLEVKNSEFWEDMADATPEKRLMYRRIADVLERQGDYHRFKPLANFIKREYDDAKALRAQFNNVVAPFESSAYQPSEQRRKRKNEIHEAQRQLIISMWEKLFSIKEFGRKDVSLEEAYQMITRFDSEGIDIIDDQFNVSNRVIEPIHPRYARFAQNGNQHLGYGDIQETIDSARNDLQQIHDYSAALWQLNFGTG